MLFLHSLLCGGFLLAVYDGIRIFRLFVPHKTVAEGAEDLFYWVFDALFIFHMLYRENSGAVRGYAIVGVLLGMLAYHRAFSPPVMWLGMKLAHGFRKIMEIVKNTLKKIVKPFTMMVYNFKGEAGRRDGKETYRLLPTSRICLMEERLPPASLQAR